MEVNARLSKMANLVKATMVSIKYPTGGGYRVFWWLEQVHNSRVVYSNKSWFDNGFSKRNDRLFICRRLDSKMDVVGTWFCR